MTALDLDRLTAAIPGAVDVALKTVFRERYTPELAAQIAEDVTARLRQAQQADSGDHYPWCKPGACTLHPSDDGTTWVEHSGHAHNTVITGENSKDELRLVAQLHADEALVNPAPIVHLYDEDGAGVFLDVPALDKAVVQLEGLTGLLRVFRDQMTADRTGVQV